MNSPVKLPDMSWSLIEALPEDAVTGVIIYASQAVREALATKSEWMPIETAPPLHKQVLLINVGNRPNYVTDQYVGWLTMSGDYARWPHPFPPSHWMPTPAPPKENNHGDTP